MRCTGKGIYIRFRISNQIFNSNYGSQDIVHSLYTNLAISAKIFVDEYLKNWKKILTCRFRKVLRID